MATTIIRRAKAANYGDPVERRRYNREYMQRWRADPRHRERERANREQSQYLRKLRNARGGPVCGFCHLRRAKSKVLRLMPVKRGFVNLLVPYCGQC